MSPTATIFTGAGIRTAQALGIAGSAFLSGSIISISTIQTPALLIPGAFFFPNQAAVQWKALYVRGKRSMPTLAAIASSAYFYLAYKFSEYSHSLTRKYVVAGLLTLGILPYARLVMAGTNDELIDKAVSVPTERKNVADEGAVRELIERWSTMNLVRGLLPLTGTLMALNATFF